MASVRYLNADLYVLHGVLIHQEDHNSYVVNQIPHDAIIGKYKTDSNIWTPNYESIQKLPTLIKFTKEEDICTCCYCLGMQNPAKLDAYEQDTIKILEIERSRSLGCLWRCHQSSLKTKFIDEGHTGAAIEDRNFSNCCKAYFCCNHYLKIDVSVPNAPRINKMRRYSEKESYTVKIHTSCFGPNCNTCGGTSCNKLAIYDIIHVDSQKVVGNIQKMFITGTTHRVQNCAYAVKFPEAASQEERMMLIVSTLQHDN